jgi:nitroreductase
MADLASTPLPADTVGLIEGLTSTRAIRQYRDEPVPEEVLRAILFCATRAPSGSNRQPFRFVVLRDGPRARAVKELIGTAARKVWDMKRVADGYERGSAIVPDSPKGRMARVMQQYVDEFERVPVLILPCLVRYREPSPVDGANVYPACQNLLLAARALGYGGVLTSWHFPVEQQIREVLDVPDGVYLAATITIGKPAGRQGPVRRRPINELVFEEAWEQSPAWALDPPGTTFTAAGPPPPP